MNEGFQSNGTWQLVLCLVEISLRHKLNRIISTQSLFFSISLTSKSQLRSNSPSGSSFITNYLPSLRSFSFIYLKRGSNVPYRSSSSLISSKYFQFINFIVILSFPLSVSKKLLSSMLDYSTLYYFVGFVSMETFFVSNEEFYL